EDKVAKVPESETRPTGTSPEPNPEIELSTPPKPAQPPPRISRAATSISTALLQNEIDLAWKESEKPVASASTVLKVSRVFAANASGQFHSIAQACEAAIPGRDTVIEIQDNGPFYELPCDLKARRLCLRAAAGYRPLIILDVLNPQVAKAGPFFELNKGR